jgi:hypothetical protein
MVRKISPVDAQQSFLPTLNRHRHRWHYDTPDSDDQLKRIIPLNCETSSSRGLPTNGFSCAAKPYPPCIFDNQVTFTPEMVCALYAVMVQ